MKRKQTLSNATVSETFEGFTTSSNKRQKLSKMSISFLTEESKTTKQNVTKSTSRSKKTLIKASKLSRLANFPPILIPTPIYPVMRAPQVIPSFLLSHSQTLATLVNNKTTADDYLTHKLRQFNYLICIGALNNFSGITNANTTWVALENSPFSFMLQHSDQTYLLRIHDMLCEKLPNKTINFNLTNNIIIIDNLTCNEAQWLNNSLDSQITTPHL